MFVVSPVTEDAEEDITISSETDYLSPGDAVNITWIPERISMGLFASDEAFVNVVMVREYIILNLINLTLFMPLYLILKINNVNFLIAIVF